MADVFVSYKAEDRRRIRLLVEALEQDGLSVWWDAHVGAGQEWREKIAIELDSAKCVIVGWSKRSIGPEGRFVRDEASRALRRNAYVPFKLDRVDPPLGFGETQVVPLIGWSGDRSAPAYQDLLSAIRIIVSGEKVELARTSGIEAPTRRAILVGAVAAAGATALGGGWFWFRGNGLSAEAQALVQQAREGVNDGGVEANANAIGKLRQAAELEPRAALVWGLLALAYMQQSRVAPTQDRQGMIARGTAAVQRARSLEEDQPEAMAAEILAMPLFRNWLAVEAKCRAALKKHPRNPYLLWRLAEVLSQVGRDEECLGCVVQVMEDISTPFLHIGRTMLLWNLARFDEAESELQRMFSLWPRHYAVWFTRFYYLLYNGKAAEALAFIKDASSRPIGIPDWNFALVQSQADALAAGNPHKIETALAGMEEVAHKAAGFAENAAIFASFVGAADTAFKLLRGLYTNAGFSVGETWFSSEQAIYIGRERNTYILFQLPMRNVRQDPRFGVLARELGLADYWKGTNSRAQVIV
jgi:tetratricopeptide (TPR) repeat protein